MRKMAKKDIDKDEARIMDKVKGQEPCEKTIVKKIDDSLTMWPN